jgi:hypothetical protein
MGLGGRPWHEGEGRAGPAPLPFSGAAPGFARPYTASRKMTSVAFSLIV